MYFRCRYLDMPAGVLERERFAVLFSRLPSPPYHMIIAAAAAATSHYEPARLHSLLFLFLHLKPTLLSLSSTPSRWMMLRTCAFSQLWCKPAVTNIYMYICIYEGFYHGSSSLELFVKFPNYAPKLISGTCWICLKKILPQLTYIDMLWLYSYQQIQKHCVLVICM